jgi:hypothetical protein
VPREVAEAVILDDTPPWRPYFFDPDIGLATAG